MRVTPRVWVGFAAALVFAVLLLVQTALIGGPQQWPAEIGSLWLQAVVPLAAAVVVLVAGVSLAHGWPGVLIERPRSAHRFPAVAPVLLALAAVINLTATGWSSLELGRIAVLIAWGVLLGFGSELVFRGILLVCLRTRHREPMVWILTSLVFALLQGLLALIGTSALGADLLAAAGQLGFAFLVATCLYIARRVTGSLVWAMLLHATWAIGLVARDAAPAAEPIGAVVAGVAGVAALLAVPWALRRR